MDPMIKNSFFTILIYWNDNRIHLGLTKKLIFFILFPPLLRDLEGGGLGGAGGAEGAEGVKALKRLRWLRGSRGLLGLIGLRGLRELWVGGGTK